MMTYRERRENRAAKLREWAAKREAAAKGTLNADWQRYGGDTAFNTQPGHIAERERVIARTERAFESLRKAESMSNRADNIEAAADRSIYSDDPGAIERLRERIANLEEQRGRIKAYNATCRKGQPDESLLDDAQRENLATIRRVAAYQLGKNGAYPSYALTNLSGNISRNRERFASLERAQIA